MSAPNTAPDAADVARIYADIAQKSGQLLTQFLQPKANGASLPFLQDQLGITKAFFEAWSKLLTDPFSLAQAQMKLWQDYAALWQSTMFKALGGDSGPVVTPPDGDRRFRHEDWEQSFLHDYIKQSYLIAAKHLHQTLANAKGLDAKTAKKVDFYTRQYIDALSPSNFLFTNPEVLRETLATGGQNLIKGLNNLLEDLSSGNGAELRVKMTDTKAFRLGENIAVTPGQVVFQNDLLQLIQYAPRTEKVYARPLLIIPPWINKFYILDLREKNSFIRWAVEQGHTVFVISWVNPDKRLAHKTFEDYLTEGALAALKAVERATGQPDANVIGYCLGGTLLASTLAWLAARKENRIHSATFFVSMIDFREPGELGVFIDEEQVKNLESKMKKRGYLEGSEMAMTFNAVQTGRHQACGRADRRQPDSCPRVFHIDRRRPYRAVEIDVRGRAAVKGPSTVCIGGLGPHRRHHQSAERQQILLLGQRRTARKSGRMAEGRTAASGLLVDGLGRVDCRARRRNGESACTRQGQAESHRRRAGQLR
jgi:polyhydroxyalkanoate synthase